MRGRSKYAVCVGTAEVGVDDDHRDTGLRERRRQVHDGDRLAFGGSRRRDQQRAQRTTAVSPFRPPVAWPFPFPFPLPFPLLTATFLGWRCHIASNDVRNDRYASAVNDAGSAEVATWNRSARSIFTTGISAMTGIRAADFGSGNVTDASTEKFGDHEQRRAP